MPVIEDWACPSRRRSVHAGGGKQGLAAGDSDHLRDPVPALNGGSPHSGGRRVPPEGCRGPWASMELPRAGNGQAKVFESPTVADPAELRPDRPAPLRGEGQHRDGPR